MIMSSAWIARVIAAVQRFPQRFFGYMMVNPAAPNAGNSFQSSASVTPTPFVGELEIGLAVMFAGFRLSYTQVFQTQEFKHQHGGLHQFGSFALSAHF